MRSILAISVLLLMTACVSSYQPVVDLKGRQTGQYQQDLFECQQLAQQSSPWAQSAETGLGGALLGAALGAVTGAFLPGYSAGTGAAFGAATGGTVGVLGGAYQGVGEQQRIVDRCLRGRGYNVVND